MSELKKKPSGASYKRKAKEKEERFQNVIKHTKNIETFFSKPKSDDSELSNAIIIHSVSATDPVQCETPTSSIQPQDLFVPTPSTSSAVDVVQQSQNTIIIVDCDPAKWSINNETQEYIALNGFNQNINVDFSLSKRIYEDKVSRFLTKTMFERKLLNREKRPRKWLIYSPSTGKVFCGPCLLFGGGTSFGKQDVGFNDWKNASIRLESHENSCEHKTCVLALQRRSDIVGRVDHELVAQFQEELTYWREVLKRVVATVKSLASRGLSFRGHEEKLGSLHNGNYLMTLELIAEFDPFLSKHIAQYGGKGKGCTNYLSSTICDEFIELMANKILTQIKDEIKISKYYSMIVDSTPDISHIDQLTLVIRYVKADGTPVERFLKFIAHVGHKSQDMADAIIKTLDMFEINILDCRGQSYDNAANMSGIYNGLQAKIKELCPLADYIPCSAHSLNLVGECAAECVQEACWFFGLLQEIYTFFTASTQRWETLQPQIRLGNDKKNKPTVKNPSDTRWSARADACKSLKESFSEIHDALIAIESNPAQKRSTVCEAKGIRFKLERLETAFMTVFWSFILVHMNKSNKKLQSVDIDICTVVQLYDSIIHIISTERGNFDKYEQQALELSLVKEYEKDTKRIRKRKLTADESAEDITSSLSGRETFRRKAFEELDKRSREQHQELLLVLKGQGQPTKGVKREKPGTSSCSEDEPTTSKKKPVEQTTAPVKETRPSRELRRWKPRPIRPRKRLPTHRTRPKFRQWS
ncbi:zinc finger MYM-type protein 1-like [Anoplophora glabripennis]|uniref:zinc finger MYM-type protein 1-like n=1 Tax=Anoplophora glabripennis TaxID=217634 RepID=UPI000C7900B8|nr:zinc finger MYM-type protein 1-like [Anoplophora glabripennis]